MSSVPINKLSAAEKDQLAISYAAFVLEGSGAEINADSLTAVVKASGLTANKVLVNAVAKALKGKKVSEFFGSVSGGSAPAPEKAKKEEKPKQTKKAPAPVAVEEPEEDMEMGGLFD